jgi:hypothetical protein
MFVQFPWDEQTFGEFCSSPRQLVNSHIVPKYPLLQLQKSLDVQFPFDEQAFLSVAFNPKHRKIDSGRVKFGVEDIFGDKEGNGDILGKDDTKGELNILFSQIVPLYPMKQLQLFISTQDPFPEQT